MKVIEYIKNIQIYVKNVIIVINLMQSVIIVIENV